jgi:tryptophan-rich hypothetical protein
MPTNAPQNPDKLIGSKWSAVEVEEKRKHWEVVSWHPDDGEVTLRAVLDGETTRRPWRQLRDRERWEPGWT